MKIVYLITNALNNKKYVGLDRNNTRWKEHLRRSRKNNPIQLIDRKIKQYGENNFNYKILCWCKTIYQLKKYEKFYIKLYDSLVINKRGYNLTEGGDGCKGFKMPIEKIRKGKLHHMFGKKQSKESNEKRSQKMKEVRKNTVNPFTLPHVRKILSNIAKNRTGSKNTNYKHGKRTGVNK